MVDPQFFYSTLAQASAAVVGFVVAVGAALYSFERQRVEKRTGEYRDALLELRNRYEFALQTLANMLEGAGGETDEEMLDLNLTNDELRKMAYDKSESKPVTTLFLAHIQRMLLLLHKIQPENEYILTADELDNLQQSVGWYSDHFYKLDSTSREFIREVTGKSYDEFEYGSLAPLFREEDSIQGFSAFNLQGWFERRRQLDSEILRPEYREKDSTDDREERLTGDNFWTLKSLVEYLVNDTQKASKKSHGSVIRYEPGINPVVRVSSYLIIVGVIVPTLFLVNSPISHPLWFILTSQIALLLATVTLSIVLIEMILRGAEPTNRMGDLDELSAYSSFIARNLPKFPR